MPALCRLILAATLTLAAGFACAEPSKVARAYMEASGFADIIASMVPDIVAQEEAMLRQAMPEADEEAVAAFMRFFAEELEARVPALTEGAAEVADRVYTEEEMREITALLGTDLGRRFVEGSVSYQQELFGLTREWMMGSGQEAAAAPPHG